METSDPLDALYGGAPEDFVATRDRLVRELKQAGDAEQARALAKRRRPTVVADALNRLARARPEDLHAFLALGDRIRDAQVQAAGDADARPQLRALERERRERLDALVEAIGEHREETQRTLNAALADRELASTVAAGHLERVPESTGEFGDLADAFGDLPVPEPDDRRRRAERARLAEKEDTARRNVERATVEVQRVQDQLRTAEQRLAAAQRDADEIAAEREGLDGD